MLSWLQSIFDSKVAEKEKKLEDTQADLEKKYVLVLGKDHVVLRRDIKPGRLLDDGYRVVLAADGEPLTADDWIITLGLQRARVNDPVEPFDADGQAIASSSKSSAK